MDNSLSSELTRVGWIIGSCGVAFVWTWLASRPAIRHLRNRHHVHWSETARLIYPCAGAAHTVTLCAPWILALGTSLLLDASTFYAWLIAVAASIGAYLGSIPLSRHLYPGFPIRLGHLLTTPVRNPWMVLGAFILLMPSRLGPGAWALFALHVVVVCAQNLWPIGIGRLFGSVRRAPAHIELAVRQQCTECEVPLRGVWILKSPVSGAWAYPVSQDIVLTDSIVRNLTEPELQSVLVHELDHLAEPTAMTLGRLISTNSWLPVVLIKPLCGTWGVAGIGPLMLWWICVPWLFSRWVLSHERQADARAIQSDPTQFARALLRLHEVNLAPAVLERQTSHPHLYDRLLACGITPDFPRPTPAPVMNLMGSLTSGTLGILGFLVLKRWVTGD